MFVYELSSSWFEASCNHLNFRFRTCFEQGVPWHSGNYIVWIHSETRTWRDKNIQFAYNLCSSRQHNTAKLMGTLSNNHFPTCSSNANKINFSFPLIWKCGYLLELLFLILQHLYYWLFLLTHLGLKAFPNTNRLNLSSKIQVSIGYWWINYVFCRFCHIRQN